jgi:transposase
MRSYPAVDIEACGTLHYWARELMKLGHEVRLMPPAYVKPYVKRGKTDAAEAVCEAVTRPTMRFVPVKSPEQQAALSMHRTTHHSRRAARDENRMIDHLRFTVLRSSARACLVCFGHRLGSFRSYPLTD